MLPSPEVQDYRAEAERQTDIEPLNDAAQVVLLAAVLAHHRLPSGSPARAARARSQSPTRPLMPRHPLRAE